MNQVDLGAGALWSLMVVSILVGVAMVEQVLRTGRVSRGWIGVGVQDLTEELAQTMGVGSTHGAVVNMVEPNGPAKVRVRFHEESWELTLEANAEVAIELVGLYLQGIPPRKKPEDEGPMAAAALYVHPNTVRYRLRRISDLTGLDTQSFSGLVELLTIARLSERQVEN